MGCATVGVKAGERTRTVNTQLRIGIPTSQADHHGRTGYRRKQPR